MNSPAATEIGRAGDIDYDTPIRHELQHLEAAVRACSAGSRWPSRWLALGLLTGDPAVAARLESLPDTAEVRRLGAAAAARVREAVDDPALSIADSRFSYIAVSVDNGLVVREPRSSTTDRLDRVVTSRFFGLPILLAVLWVMFKVTTEVTAPLVDWVDSVVAGPVAGILTAGLGLIRLDGTWVERLVVDGLLRGVGGVLVFLPVMAVLFAALAVLEDSGYLARAAFVMDRVLRVMRLPGKAFLPVLLGFGCNVPAVYATRVLDERRDRILTGLVTPFASCAARLPVYLLIAAAFFPGQAGTVVFGLYVGSIVAIVLVGSLLSKLLFRGDPRTPFLMELPPYRRPSARLIGRLVRQRCASFLRRAGTVILACSMFVWVLGAIPVRGPGSFGEVPPEDSALAATARSVSVIFAPAGFDTWQITSALTGGFVAKEVVVSTLGQVYGTEVQSAAPADTTVGQQLRESAVSLPAALYAAARTVPSVVGIELNRPQDDQLTSLQSALRADLDRSSGGHPGLAALAFLVLVLLYVPCMATVAAQRSELGSRWMWVSLATSLTVAWTASALTFRIGLLLGLG